MLLTFVRILSAALVAGSHGAPDAASPSMMNCAAWCGEELILLTTGTDRGLALWDGTDLLVLSDAPGAGRNAFLLGDSVLWKECPGGDCRIAARLDGATRILVEGSGLSGPFPAPGGFLYSDGSGAHLCDLDGRIERTWSEAAGSPSACLAGDALWFVDGSGTLCRSSCGRIVPLQDGTATVSCSGGFVLARSIDGYFTVFDQATPAVVTGEAPGMWPVLLPGGEVLHAGRAQGGGCTGVVSLTPPGGASIDLTGDVRAVRPMLRPGSGLVWTDAESGILTGPGAPRGIPRFIPATLRAPSPRLPAEAEVDVPWMHQRWDTPDWFNGSWSCGPSSCMMAAQYYDRLTPDSIWCSSPSPGHWAPWGGYIPSIFTFLGVTYDIWGLSPGSVWVQGAHGFICRDAGGAYWNYICEFLENCGLSSGWAGTGWSTLTDEIDASWPVVCSSTIYYSGGTYGHIILFTGWYGDRTVVVNDPYGDANYDGWGQSWQYPAGKACLYDWPGYNNGHLEIGAVNQLFLARHDVLGQPDTLVDDLSLGFGKRGPCQFWHESSGGWEGSFWWTWSTGGASVDTCFAKWRPSLPQEGIWEVRVFIPSTHASAPATYRLSTQAGPVEVTVDQSLYDDEWAVLGAFALSPGDSLYLGDASSQGGLPMAFDAALFHYSGPSGTQPDPPDPPGPQVVCPGRGCITVLPPPGCRGASVLVFDSSGRLVEHVALGEGAGGTVIGSTLPAGVYSVVLETGEGRSRASRTVLVR